MHRVARQALSGWALTARSAFRAMADDVGRRGADHGTLSRLTAQYPTTRATADWRVTHDRLMELSAVPAYNLRHGTAPMAPVASASTAAAVSAPL